VGDGDTLSHGVSHIILKSMLIANPPESFPAKDVFGRWMELREATIRSNHFSREESYRSAPYTPRTPTRGGCHGSNQIRSSQKRHSSISTLAQQTPEVPHGGEDSEGSYGEPSCASPKSSAWSSVPRRRSGDPDGHGHVQEDMETPAKTRAAHAGMDPLGTKGGVATRRTTTITPHGT